MIRKLLCKVFGHRWKIKKEGAFCSRCHFFVPAAAFGRAMIRRWLGGKSFEYVNTEKP